jgi:hypothetical protein
MNDNTTIEKEKQLVLIAWIEFELIPDRPFITITWLWNRFLT